jgi:hypothetical protein
MVIRLLVAVALVILAISQGASAQGLIGGLIDRIAPGVGTALDDLHRQVKDAIPPYKMIEEGASHVVNETLVQSGAPLLQAMIIESRDDAIRNGVQPVPIEIQRNLAGFVSSSVLSGTRYRVGGGGDLSLQVNSIRYGEASAITLDFVVVFANANDAQYNPTLWAHELKHIEQFRSWGVRDFAIRYLRNHQAVEREAYETETRYVAWVGSQNAGSRDPFGRPVSSFGQTSASNACGTAFGVCRLAGSAPVGTPCWCATAVGPATGSLIPVNMNFSPGPGPMPPPPRPGFPTGYPMLGCGCWGPPAPSAPELRCSSGFVRPIACAGFCPAGGSPYGWACG